MHFETNVNSIQTAPKKRIIVWNISYYISCSMDITWNGILWIFTIRLFMNSFQIFALFIFAFLISICIFLYYKSRNRESVEETDIHVEDHQLKNSLPKQELHLDFDFIDDSITFDI